MRKTSFSKTSFSKLIIMALCLCGLLSGCISRQSYLEGTSISLGAYLPVDGSLYGLNVISYIDGCKIQVPTNACVNIQRESIQHNNWMFGMMESTTTNKTYMSTAQNF